MGIPTPITWSINGGITSKDAPLMLQPGSHDILDNVRQERRNEWRSRAGFTHDTNDDLPGGVPLVCAQETPWGGLIGLTRATTAATSGRSFSPNALPRWITPPLIQVNGVTTGEQTCSQLTPAIWNRTSISPTMGWPPSAVTSAEGGGYRLTGWWSRFAGNIGVQYALTATSGASLDFQSQLDQEPFAVRPRAVYCSAANMLTLVWASSSDGHIRARRWSTLTGLPVGGVSTLSTTGRAGIDCFLDAIYYGGATITVAYRNATGTGQLDLVEYNPATDTVASTGHTALDCSNCLNLFPDPDASGVRFVGITNATPEIHVLRCTSAGAVTTNDLVVAGNAPNIVGCAYEAGASWMVVFQSALGMVAVKRRGGVTSPPAILAGVTVSPLFYLASQGWREPGTDAMRYVLEAFGTGADPHHNFYEMALEFENGSAAIFNWWTEPQARMLPGTGIAEYYESGTLPQVQRIGADNFVTALGRITKLNSMGDSTGVAPYDTAIDAWSVQYRNSTTYTNQNASSAGTQTSSAAFLVAGSLLQTATGQLLVAHGASCLPFKPTAVASVGAGSLNPANTYIYGVTVRMPDENGNDWRSAMSITTSIKPGGANNTVTLAIVLTPFENLVRRRIVDIWRTDGNGSTFKLLHSMSSTVLATTSFSYVDASLDVAGGELYTAEVQTGLTPPLSHVALWNDRLWGADRDFPGTVWFTKPLTVGLLPEFVADPATGVTFTVDVIDQFGAPTGLAAMDDKLAITKTQALYVLGGDGPDNAGNGSFPFFNRISSEQGHIVGGSLASTGREVYVTSLGGVWRVGGGQGVDFVGSAIDAYLSMPLLNSKETVIGMVVSPGKNEVRIQTTNYRFVHDRVFNVWERDTGGMAAATGIVMTRMLGGTTQLMFLASGAVWREAADSATPSDAGTNFQGRIESAWIRPNGPEGLIQLFHGRVLGQITAAATVAQPALTVFFDNDDTKFEVFHPTQQITSTGPAPIRADAQVRNQRCSTFKMRLDLPSGDATVRLDAWSASVHVWPHMQPLPVAQKWGASLVVPAPSPAPPYPPDTALPVPRYSYNITKLASQTLGTQGQNSRDLLVQVKNALVASGAWKVMGSCDGTLISSSDLWTDWTKLLGAGGGAGFSWLILKNVRSGVEVLFGVTVSVVWTEVTQYISPSGTFSGGTALVFPTAADQYQVNPFGAWCGTMPNGNPQFHAFVWQTVDGQITRVGWWYGGKWISFWQLETIQHPCGGSWVPFMALQWNGGNNYTSPSIFTLTEYATTQHKVRTNTGTNEHAAAVYEQLGGSAIVNNYPQNEQSGQYFWQDPMGLVVDNGIPPRDGPIGYMADNWWVGEVAGVPVFNDGDTAGGGAFIFAGQLMLPWDGTLNPPTGGASVDRAASNFFGRNVG
jgi:hypothetical protein